MEIKKFKDSLIELRTMLEVMEKIEIWERPNSIKEELRLRKITRKKDK